MPLVIGFVSGNLMLLNVAHRTPTPSKDKDKEKEKPTDDADNGDDDEALITLGTKHLLPNQTRDTADPIDPHPPAPSLVNSTRPQCQTAFHMNYLFCGLRRSFLHCGIARTNPFGTGENRPLTG
jgi:hypothetical protein